MRDHRSTLICAAAQDVDLPAEFAANVLDDCPWLDGTAEVAESIGLELLSEHALRAKLSSLQVEQFFLAYNTRVRAFVNPFVARQSEAYSQLCATLIGQGRPDAFGDGDYWVVSDSFSTRTPTIVVFNGFSFSGEAIRSMQRIVSQYAGIFSELRISTEEGAEVLTLQPE